MACHRCGSSHVTSAIQRILSNIRQNVAEGFRSGINLPEYDKQSQGDP
ncbi:hypothetical protein RSSM_00723 [Rhodopirellula sallentina SM41]|uniref:Uncharacterized protein n=1 Tax=Rhodopirellula sallentina SM41 TaxID=1263870 RepID=M5U8U1_9BACT|nr:hypothetical protein RSSM_00723 [Rhodopirellula sallentina SM41]